MREVSSVDALGVQGCKGAQIDVLADRLAYVSGTREHTSREILDSDYVIARREYLPQQRADIKPLVRGAFQRSVKEIKAIDIYYRFHLGISEKARAVPCGAALHPFAEAIRGLDGKQCNKSLRAAQGVKLKFLKKFFRGS